MSNSRNPKTILKKKLFASLLLMLIASMTLNAVLQTNASSTEISVINPETHDNNFTFYNSTTPVSFRFNATVWLYSVIDLFAYNLYLCINDTLLNITNAWRPVWDPDWVFYGKSSVGTIPAFYDFDGDNYIECAKIADSLMGVDSFEGSGLLAIVEFEIIYTPTTGSVSCNLDINNDDTFLLDGFLEEMPTAKTSGHYEYVSLPPGTSTISIVVNATSVVVGETVSITGSIIPSKIDVTVTIQCKLNVTGEVWLNLTKTQTDSNSEYNYMWSTTEAGTFELKSLWEGDVNVTGAESKAKLLEVKYTSTISISIPSTSKNVTVGSIVVISGEITPAPLKAADVTIEYRCLNKTSLVWQYLDTTTAINGLYSYDWRAVKTWAAGVENETVELKAKWLGDNVTFESESQTEKVVVWKVIVKVTINVSAQEVVTGSNVTISGTVEPAIANLSITIGKSRDRDAELYTLLTEVDTKPDGSYNYFWNISIGMSPGEIGEWYLKAYVLTDAEPNAYRTNLSYVEPAFINILSGKMNSSITINVHPSTVYIGSKVIINGTITPTRADRAVTIHFLHELVPGHFPTLNSDPQGNFNLTWEAGFHPVSESWKGGEYQLYASWKGDEVTAGANSSIITLTVLRNSSSLTIYVSEEDVTLDSNVTITGTLTPAKATDIAIYYRNVTGSWVPLATVPTDATGFLNYTWTPEKAGNFEIYANWTGDDIYAPAESEIVQLKVVGPFSILAYLPYIVVGIVVVVIVVAVAYLFMKRKKKLQ